MTTHGGVRPTTSRKMHGLRPSGVVRLHCNNMGDAVVLLL
jgi:hypothetical protein